MSGKKVEGKCRANVLENVCQHQETERVSKSTWALPAPPAKRSTIFFKKNLFLLNIYFFSFYSFKQKFWNIFSDFFFFNRKFRKVLSNQGFHFRSNQGFCRLSLEEEKDYKSLFFLIRFRKNYLKFLFIFFMTHWNYNVLSAHFFFSPWF